MDDLVLLQLQMAEDQEDQDEEDRMMQAMAVTAPIVAGAKQSCLNCAQNCLPSRLYLCRPQLCPNPRVGTPWQYLYHSRSN